MTSPDASFDRRMVDNTLPQSASHFLATRQQRVGVLDLWAKEAFNTFVDTFINAPVRLSVLPGKDVGTGDFVSLWQKQADEPPERGLPPGAINVNEPEVLSRFFASLSVSQKKWAGWLAFQLTPDIGEQYQGRVADWRDRLASSVDTIRAETSLLSMRRNESIVRFSNEILGPCLEATATDDIGFAPDPAYLDEAQRLGVDFSTFAIAYGYDWYRRGFDYVRLSGSDLLRFHPLRSTLRQAIGRGEGPTLGPDEVKWSSILRAYSNRRLLPAEPEGVADTLQALRYGVHKDPEVDFRKQMAAASVEPDYERQKNLRKEAVVEVLMRARIDPVRKSTGRADYFATAEKVVSAALAPTGADIAVPIVSETIRVGVRSRAFVRLEYRLRRRFRPESVWQCFEVPGLTTSR